MNVYINLNNDDIRQSARLFHQKICVDVYEIQKATSSDSTNLFPASYFFCPSEHICLSASMREMELEVQIILSACLCPSGPV